MKVNTAATCLRVPLYIRSSSLALCVEDTVIPRVSSVSPSGAR